MFDAKAAEDSKLRALRFMVGLVVMFASLAVILNLRRFGLAPVLRIGTPAAALALALIWLKADDSKISRHLGRAVLAFMCAASVADVVWCIFLP